MLIYMFDERKTLDADSLDNNKYLKTLIKLKLDYKIPFIILLTHCDNYFDEVKKTEKNWKSICKNSYEQNKKDLIKYIRDLIGNEYKKEYGIEDDDILHTVLIDIEPKIITDEDIINSLEGDDKEDYEKADENGKKVILKLVKKIMNNKGNEVENFMKELHVLGQKELIEKLKEKIPTQHHNAFIEVK